MDITTVQYDGNGTQRWAQRHSGGGTCSMDYGYGVAVDALNNVVVTGKLGGGYQQGDFGTLKYNGNGKRLWLRTYPGGQASAVALDGTGERVRRGTGGWRPEDDQVRP
jgi:hypothetical protein